MTKSFGVALVAAASRACNGMNPQIGMEFGRRVQQHKPSGIDIKVKKPRVLVDTTAPILVPEVPVNVNSVTRHRVAVPEIEVPQTLGNNWIVSSIMEDAGMEKRKVRKAASKISLFFEHSEDEERALFPTDWYGGGSYSMSFSMSYEYHVRKKNKKHDHPDHSHKSSSKKSHTPHTHESKSESNDESADQVVNVMFSTVPHTFAPIELPRTPITIVEQDEEINAPLEVTFTLVDNTAGSDTLDLVMPLLPSDVDEAETYSHNSASQDYKVSSSDQHSGSPSHVRHSDSSDSFSKSTKHHIESPQHHSKSKSANHHIKSSKHHSMPESTKHHNKSAKHHSMPGHQNESSDSVSKSKKHHIDSPGHQSKSAHHNGSFDSVSKSVKQRDASPDHQSKSVQHSSSSHSISKSAKHPSGSLDHPSKSSYHNGSSDSANKSTKQRVGSSDRISNSTKHSASSHGVSKSATHHSGSPDHQSKPVRHNGSSASDSKSAKKHGGSPDSVSKSAHHSGSSGSVSKPVKENVGSPDIQSKSIHHSGPSDSVSKSAPKHTDSLDHHSTTVRHSVSKSATRHNGSSDGVNGSFSQNSYSVKHHSGSLESGSKSEYEKASADHHGKPTKHHALSPDQNGNVSISDSGSDDLGSSYYHNESDEITNYSADVHTKPAKHHHSPSNHHSKSTVHHSASPDHHLKVSIGDKDSDDLGSVYNHSASTKDHGSKSTRHHSASPNHPSKSTKHHTTSTIRHSDVSISGSDSNDHSSSQSHSASIGHHSSSSASDSGSDDLGSSYYHDSAKQHSTAPDHYNDASVSNRGSNDLESSQSHSASIGHHSSSSVSESGSDDLGSSYYHKSAPSDHDSAFSDVQANSKPVAFEPPTSFMPVSDQNVGLGTNDNKSAESKPEYVVDVPDSDTEATTKPVAFDPPASSMPVPDENVNIDNNDFEAVENKPEYTIDVPDSDTEESDRPLVFEPPSSSMPVPDEYVDFGINDVESVESKLEEAVDMPAETLPQPKYLADDPVIMIGIHSPPDENGDVSTTAVCDSTATLLNATKAIKVPVPFAYTVDLADQDTISPSTIAAIEISLFDLLMENLLGCQKKNRRMLSDAGFTRRLAQSAQGVRSMTRQRRHLKESEEEADRVLQESSESCPRGFENQVLAINEWPEDELHKNSNCDPAIGAQTCYAVKATVTVIVDSPTEQDKVLVAEHVQCVVQELMLQNDVIKRDGVVGVRYVPEDDLAKVFIGDAKDAKMAFEAAPIDVAQQITTPIVSDDSKKGTGVILGFVGIGIMSLAIALYSVQKKGSDDNDEYRDESTFTPRKLGPLVTSQMLEKSSSPDRMVCTPNGLESASVGASTLTSNNPDLQMVPPAPPGYAALGDMNHTMSPVPPHICFDEAFMVVPSGSDQQDETPQAALRGNLQRGDYRQLHAEEDEVAAGDNHFCEL